MEITKGERMSGRRTITFLSALALTAFACPPAHAWGPEGHAIVADIAEAHLTPSAAAQVAQLLTLDGHSHLDEIASWPDEIRHVRPETAHWHYVDIPLASSDYDPARDCANGNCVIAKIVEFTGVLSNPSADPAARVEALKWVVHFVGDLHQPLHAENSNDRGGNDVKLTYFGKPTNLHAIWDGGIIEHVTGLQIGPSFTFDHPAVATVARGLDAAIIPANRQEWAPEGLLGNFQPWVVSWAIEGHAAAQLVAYPYLPSAGQVDWSDTYQAQAWPVVELQLQRAGVRLAEILNEALQ
jgi:hypothetical protein